MTQPLIEANPFILVALSALLVAVGFGSIAIILKRMGFSGWWVLAAGLWPIALPVLAFCRWPAFEKNSN